MQKVVFCEVAWMKYYAGIYGNDKPMNGGKFIDENGEGGEIYNFFPYNHKCYGYVMHYGDELHIERYDKILKEFDEVRDMTVVWVASDGKSSKIVGWYEHATMYRYWQAYYDIKFAGPIWNEYNFVADEKDCYLIDEKDRLFVIPRAPIAGKGRGMGQSQVWYADSVFAQEEFIPKVLHYLESVKDKTKPIYVSKDKFLKCAEDQGQTVEELIQIVVDSFGSENENISELFEYANLAVAKDDCFQTRDVLGDLYAALGCYNEAEEEYKKALYFKENINTLDKLMYIEMMLNHSFLVIELGEKMHERKDEVENWSLVANNLAFTYIEECEFDLAEALICECENDHDRKYKWIKDAKNELKEQKKLVKQSEK